MGRFQCLKGNIEVSLIGSVQRKLRWVKSNANRWVLASDSDAGHFFPFLICCHFIFAFFPFPGNTAQLIGKFWKYR
jgi:hypothetical protein